MKDLVIPVKCDECGITLHQVKHYGKNDFGCDECGHPVPTELVKGEVL